MCVECMGNGLMKFIDQKRDMEISFGILFNEWEGKSGKMKIKCYTNTSESNQVSEKRGEEDNSA